MTGVALWLTVRALAEEITIPWYEGDDRTPYSTNLNFYVEYLGEQKPLTVKANPGNPKCWFKENLFDDPQGVEMLSRTGNQAHSSAATYAFRVVSPSKQGSLFVSGFIEPCEGGGGGTPISRYFSLYALWRWPFAKFTTPASTNLTVCVGSTNDIETVVMLGDAKPLSGKMNWSTPLGTFTQNDVPLNAGVAQTKFIASQAGLGTLTATASELKEKGFYDLVVTVPYNATTNVVLASVQPDLDELTFGGPKSDVYRDTGSQGIYAPPHWKKGRTEQFPIAYKRNARMQVSGKFKTDPSTFTGKIKIKGQAIQGAFYFNFPETEVPFTNGEGIYPMTITSGGQAGELPDTVEIYNTLDIKWKAKPVDSTSAGFLDAGASANQVYVTLGGSQAPTLFHTVADVACRNARGASQPGPTVAGIWNDFADRNVCRVDTVPMAYWGGGPNAPKVFSTAGLVFNANGRCEAWGHFFVDTLLTHRIRDGTYSLITTANILHWKGIGICIKPLLGGQSNPSPPSYPYYFETHAVVKRTIERVLSIYDPSYGTTSGTELGWEDTSVEKLVYKSIRTGKTIYIDDYKGIQETVFTP